MKIALYYPWIYLKSGVERTILEIIKGSKNEYTIFTHYFDSKTTFPEFKKLKIVKLSKIPIKQDFLSTLQCAIKIAFQKINLSQFDLLLINSEGISDLIVLRNHKIPVVSICHTPLRPIYDISHKLKFLEKKNVMEIGVFLVFSRFFKSIDRYIWSKLNYVFFVSLESLRRAKKGGLINRNSQYSILHTGVNWIKSKLTWEYKYYFLVPGRITWSKNIELALESFKMFQRKYKGSKKFKLVIAGQVDKKEDKKYLSMLKRLGNSNVDFVIDPNDKQMNRLYSNCYAVLATAFNEDWGLTPIEGNSYGKPAICVNRGGFKESQIDGKTGFLVENDLIEFSGKMLKIADNLTLTKRLGKNARINSEQFSWSNFIDKLDTSLSNIVRI